jgi:glycosyltransferase involved in cell wall biosynthesis
MLNMKVSKIYRITTSCRSRFHIFDQARELQTNNLLYCLITDYPKFSAVKFGVKTKYIRSLIYRGIFYKILLILRKFLKKNNQIKIDKFIHNNFSKKLAFCIPKDTDFFIGLSSFCLEALQECKNRNIYTAVDHGSLHQAEERQLVLDEAKRWDLKIPTDVAADWVIEKENFEFITANYIFSPSEVAKKSLEKNGVDKNKIFINPYGVNLESFKPGLKTDNIFRIMQVGGITIGKGVLTLAKAFAIAKIPNSELIFLGGNTDPNLIQFVHKICPHNIYFLPPVPQYELPKYYAKCSVFVLASVSDGYGMVVPQAMACGLPVITTTNVGANHLISNGLNGFIVPIGDPESIAMNLQKLYENENLRKQQGINSRKTAEKVSTWSDYGKRLESFIFKKVTNVL